MSEPSTPRITFGMIVLNGLPFLPYNLRALYPFAHEIIVVEGAARGAAGIAAPDGHSRDGTLAELRRFARDEDPAGKLVLVTAEDQGYADGFWPGEKDEQSHAYAQRATGDYLWQVDVDEFYLPQDMAAIVDLLATRPEITAVTFPTVTFWGDPWCVVDGWFLRRGSAHYHRLFKWGPGYGYVSPRPPPVLDERGRDLRQLVWHDAAQTAALGVTMHHYSLLFPDQVREKVDYYSNWGLYGDWFSAARRWLADSYLTLRKPYRVHNVYRYPSWLQRFDGAHPPQIERLLTDVEAGRVEVRRRPMDDAELLLRSPFYALGRTCLKVWEPVDHWARRVRWSAGPVVRRAVHRLTGTEARP